MNPRILMIGGDNTSDRFGAALASKIHELCPQATVYGVGGPLMNDAGVRLLSDISEIVSLGVLQSMRGSTVIKRLIARVVETMDQEEPALVLQIGLPVFGLKILEIARTRGIPVLYYYTPFSRGLTHADLRKFCGVVTKVAAISRTEEALCRDAGLDVEFVGHPLMDLADRSGDSQPSQGEAGHSCRGQSCRCAAWCQGSGSEKRPARCFEGPLPVDQGSPRTADHHFCRGHHPPPLWWRKSLQNAHCSNVRLERILTACSVPQMRPSRPLAPRRWRPLCWGVPSLAVYRVPHTTYFAEKVLDRKPYMTITNKILRKDVIPEFIQGHVNHAKIAAAMEELLYNDAARRGMLEALAPLERELGAPGSVERAVGVVLEMAGCDGSDGTA